ncbi:MAG TPA: GGDEF domain-containing protein, partial [Epulopiscium sp.]|nr:GGDEF domain-containing protein [Candidatus Epulonipiscium sp.]
KFFKEYKSTGKESAIMMVDIDDFKNINDQYGHEVGDAVLMEIVKRLNHDIRSSDQLIRWGGDEFVGIFPGLREEHIKGFGEKLLTEISLLKIPVGNRTVSVTMSMGFSYFKETDIDYNDVLKRADDAMYQSKKQGKNRYGIII